MAKIYGVSERNIFTQQTKKFQRLHLQIQISWLQMHLPSTTFQNRCKNNAGLQPTEIMTKTTRKYLKLWISNCKCILSYLVSRSSQNKITVTYKFYTCNLQKSQNISSTELTRKAKKKLAKLKTFFE